MNKIAREQMAQKLRNDVKQMTISDLKFFDNSNDKTAVLYDKITLLEAIGRGETVTINERDYTTREMSELLVFLHNHIIAHGNTYKGKVKIKTENGMELIFNDLK